MAPSRADFLALIFLVALANICHGQDQGTYTVVAPRVLRPNVDYHAAVTMHGTSRPAQVNVKVGGRQDSGGNTYIEQSASVEPFTTQLVKLKIGDLGPGIYNLTVQGSGPFSFENTTELEYIHKSYSVFIQTDKAIYKPGQTVHFRVIIVDPHLKPSVTGAVNVHITDGQGNRIKQWKREFTTKGVFSSDLPLSDYPVLGDWNITVTVMGQTFHKLFEVAEYVLPKFEVSVDLPSYITYKDSSVVATVHAKYTFGKPVKGDATVTLYPTIYSGIIQPVMQPVRKTMKINGKAHFEFDVVKELGLIDDFEKAVRFEVTVEEELTKRRQNTSATLSLYKYRYKMELIKTSDSFKPGLKYMAFLKVFHHDNTPVQDDKNPVIVKHGYTYDQNEFNKTEYRIPKSGIIELTFYPPVGENVNTLGIEAQYLEYNEWFQNVGRAQSPSNTYIQAVLKTTSPQVNKDVVIDVNSTAPLKYFTYEVMGRGDLLFARTVSVPSQNAHTFSFPATFAMAPKARVVVYYVEDGGEVIADALDFEVEGTFQNFVNLEINPREGEPGKEIEVSIRTKPNSFVGVLGVDQSVLLLKSGNDITQEDVLEELKSYDVSSSFPNNIWGRGFIGRRKKRSFLWYPGSATAKEAFDNSGVVVLTNAFVYEHYPLVFYRARFNDLGPVDPLEAGAAPIPKTVQSETSASAVAPSVRTKFPETWLWENVKSLG